MADLVVPRPLGADALVPREELDRAKAYAAVSRSDNTRRAYARAWRGFSAFCATRGLDALPCAGETLALYLSHLADQGRKASGIELELVAVSQAHRLAGHPSPREHRAVQEVRRGIRRTIGVAQHGKAPMMIAPLRACIAALPTDLHGVRDRALLLLGWSGAFRRSELVALDHKDLRDTPAGLEATIRSSKTDQEGKGETLGIPPGTTASSCPIRAVRAWIAASGRSTGALFVSVDRWGKVSDRRLTGHDVARLVKRAAQAAGLDPAELSGHSLRAGLATEAVLAGKGEAFIMKRTRHKSVAVFRKYVRAVDLWRDNAAAGLL